MTAEDPWNLRPFDEPGEDLLDGDPGPARPADDAQAMRSAILDEWAQTATPATARLSAGWSAAAGLLIGFCLAGSMAAALVYTMQQEPEPEPAPARRAPSPPPVQEPVPEAEDEAEPEEERETEAHEAPAEPVQRSPRDLLADANALRRHGAYRRAAALYARVAERRAPESYSAAVAAASLELEHLNRPARAARFFRRAARLQPRGPLDLTVREGLAAAFQRSRQRTRERRALEALITRHPSSNAATRARARLRELE